MARQSTTPATQRKQWFGDDSSLETKIPALLQQQKAQEAKTLLQMSAEPDQPITQFYMGVTIGQLEGEAAACDYYARALKQLPLLHAARNNLIRGLMKRGGDQDWKQALEHVRASRTHLHALPASHGGRDELHPSAGRRHRAGHFFTPTLLDPRLTRNFDGVGL